MIRGWFCGPIRPVTTKAEAMADLKRLHAIKRAWQRHGLACNITDVLQAEARITAGDADFVAEQPGSARAFRVQLKHKRVIVVYSLVHRAIVTVLPANPRKPQLLKGEFEHERALVR